MFNFDKNPVISGPPPWTTTTFTESVDRMADEANPDFSYRAVLADPRVLKRKIVKGGSWKDRVYWLSPSTRRFLDQDKSANDIGFRCAMSMIGSIDDQTQKK